MKHIAFIMDGNRRWATQHRRPKIMGHTEGAKNLKKIIQAVKDKHIPYMTIYTLSTENLKRSEKELKHLFSLFSKLIDYLDEFIHADVQIRMIGNLKLLPPAVTKSLNKLVQKTKHNTTLTLTFAIAYGGRDEIIRAIHKIIKKNEPITEKTFTSYLDTKDIPDVDLIIRTGGHHRLSNFLLWQGSYAELYFTDTYWPAFDQKELDEIIIWYDKQHKNNGK